MNAHGPSTVRFEGFDVAKRLGSLEHRERITRLRDLRGCFVVRGDDECDGFVRSSLVVLTRRVQVSRTDAKSTRCVGTGANGLAYLGNRSLDLAAGREVRQKRHVVSRLQRGNSVAQDGCW